MPDTDLLEAFAPLRASEPTAAEVAALRARVAPRRRSRRRPALLIAGLAAVALAVTLVPGRPDDAVALLNATAAVAADQPGPAAFTGYRYAQSRDRLTLGHSSGTITIEQPVETWLDARWQGTRRAQAGRVVARAGNAGTLEASALARPSTEPFEIGDGPLANVPLAQLPTDPERLARLLDAATRDGRWSPGGGRLVPFGPDPDAAVRFIVAREALTLLTVANATPALRAGLFGVLARMPDVAATGERTDALGRRGEGLEIRFPVAALGPLPAGPGGRPFGGENVTRPDIIRVVFDPETSDVLSWSIGKDLQLRPPTGPEVPQRLGEEHLILRTAHVFEAGDRP